MNDAPSGFSATSHAIAPPTHFNAHDSLL